MTPSTAQASTIGPVAAWRTICRQLMVHEPLAGMQQIAVFTGAEQLYEPGWNRVRFGPHAVHRELFIYVSSDGGITTPVHPDVPDEAIHLVTPTTATLDSGLLWRAASTWAAHIQTLDDATWTPALVGRTMQAIEASAGTKTISDPRTALWIRRFMQVAHGAVQTAGPMNVPHAEVLRVPVDLVDAYLAFEIPGAVAQELLAVLLTIQCNFPHYGPPELARSEYRLAAFQHLANLVYDIVQDREAYDLATYLELSYLGVLYCGAAVTLAMHELTLHPDAAVDGVPLDRMKQNVEEIGAHKLAPAFQLPSLMCAGPAGVVAAQLYARNTDLGALARTFAAPAAIRTALAGRRFAPAELDDLSDAVDAAMAGRPPLDVVAAVRDRYRPVAESNKRVIMMQFLELAMRGGR